jgi:hypothetical protein
MIPPTLGTTPPARIDLVPGIYVRSWTSGAVPDLKGSGSRRDTLGAFDGEFD